VGFPGHDGPVGSVRLCEGATVCELGLTRGFGPVWGGGVRTPRAWDTTRAASAGKHVTAVCARVRPARRMRGRASLNDPSHASAVCVLLRREHAWRSVSLAVTRCATSPVSSSASTVHERRPVCVSELWWTPSADLYMGSSAPAGQLTVSYIQRGAGLGSTVGGGAAVCLAPQRPAIRSPRVRLCELTLGRPALHE